MRILFLHPNFPAQFRHVATAIAKDKRHQVVFGTTRRDGQLPGVYKALYEPSREARPETHHYVHMLESAVIQGQAVYRMAQQLKARGFMPDVVYGHSGWGPTLFSKDIFPDAKLLCYFEWFYHAHGSDADFDPSDPLNADSEARIRMKNAPILTDLYSCDRGLSPTGWQRQQFPSEYHSKITVRHDGVDTQYFCPKPGAKLVLPRINLDLSHVEELVTYVGRGMEPYRGFPQLIEAIALLQQRRPNCHAVIVGEDRVAYGKQLPDGKTYKEAMLEKFPLDLSKVHFTGHLPYDEHRQVLQASSAHVYLTRPFVLSWSMLEAMSTGCLLVASNTAPVREVIQDGVNGLLADFFSPQEIADRLEEALSHPDRMTAIREEARKTVLAHYDLATLLPQHLQWIQQDLDSKQIMLWAGGTQLKPVAPATVNRVSQTNLDDSSSNSIATANRNPSNEKRIRKHSPASKRVAIGGESGFNGKQKSKKHSPLKELIEISGGSNQKFNSQTTQSELAVEPLILTRGSLNGGMSGEQCGNANLALSNSVIDPGLLKVGNRTITSTELVTLLNQYQLLPKLQQESLIDEAIVLFVCTPEEQEQCCQEFYAQHQLLSETDRQRWLQQQGLTATQAIHLATRPFRIEKFKQATWGSSLESDFLKRKPQLDRVIYSLIRVRDASIAQEIYAQLAAGERSFAELAHQYSQGTESRTGGAIGPVPLNHSHPKLAQVLRASKPGQLSPPVHIEDIWVIVQLEKFLPAQLDAALKQRLLDERFADWLKGQLDQLVTNQIASVAAQSTS